MTYVLDACSILRYFDNDRGADTVDEALTTHTCMIHPVNATEIYYKVYEKHGNDAANDVLDWMYQALIVWSGDDREIIRIAGEIKVACGVPLGDCFCGGLANILGAPVLTSDVNDMGRISESGYCKVRYLW